MKFWSMMMLLMMMPLVSSCGGDDDGPSGDELKKQAIGLWMCIESRDEGGGRVYSGLMVGKEVNIMANNTYTSTASTFGYTGTYMLNGNTITAKSNAGTFLVTVSINGDKMSWEGTASNGTKFRYVFQREIDEHTGYVNLPSGN